MSSKQQWKQTVPFTHWSFLPVVPFVKPLQKGNNEKNGKMVRGSLTARLLRPPWPSCQSCTLLRGWWRARREVWQSFYSAAATFPLPKCMWIWRAQDNRKLLWFIAICEQPNPKNTIEDKFKKWSISHLRHYNSSMFNKRSSMSFKETRQLSFC